MKQKWIKLPNGKIVKWPIHKAPYFLSEIEPHIPVNSIQFETSTPELRQSVNPQNPYNNKSYDIRKLNNSIVSIFGAGAVGSYLSDLLGPALMKQYIVDFKKVEIKHTQGGRTKYDHNLIGLRKVDALKQKVEAEHPGTTIYALPYNITEIPDLELKHMLKLSLLGIFAFDDPEQLCRLSDLAYPIVEFIQVALHAGANSGHIAISIPFVTPCLRCTLNIKNSQDIHRLDSEPANSLDIITVVQQAARIAVDIMYSKVTGQNITRWDTSKNLIFISNTKQDISPNGPGISYENSQKRPDCPICNCR